MKALLLVDCHEKPSVQIDFNPMTKSKQNIKIVNA